MPKPTISKNGVWAVKKGAELNLSLNEMIDPHHQRLNLRTDLSEQVTKVLLMLDETIKKENNQQAIIVLNDLQETLKQIKIVYLFPPSSDDLNYFSVRSFLYLEQICLNQVPPSTVLHLYELRTHLKKLMIVHSGITNLFAVLTPVSKKWKKYLKPMITNDDLNQISNNVPPPIHGNNAPTTTPVPSIQRLPQESCWTKLLFLTLSNCGLVKIDESLHFFPNLIELDLSHNSIAYIVHLQDCIALESINLSYNRIRILSNLERTVGSVKNINLSHNEIESLDGIDKIYSLERINFANNCINDVMEAQYLSRLPCLLAMVFHNNPIVELKHYRLRVYREFIKVGSLMSGNRPFPELDKQAITKKELKKLRKLIFMSPTDAMVESSYAPVYMNGFDFSFDEFDEAEFEDYPDEEAVYPNDYRRSVVGRQSPIPGTVSPTQNANGGMNPRSSLSPTRNRSVSPFGRTNSVGNAGISTSRRTLSKRYSSDYMASSMMDARDLADFDLLRRRSSAYSRSSVIRFMRAPSTRKRRAANIYDDEVQDTFLPLSEVRRDLKENSDAWLVHEKQPEPIASTSPLAADAAKKKEAGVDATSPMSEDSKVFFPIPAPTAEGPTHPRATSPLLSHAEVKSKASFESSSTLVNEMKGAEEKLAGVHISEANSEKSTPSQSFSVAQGVEKPFPPVSYVASLDRNSNVSIYHQRPSELTAANLTAANASTNFVPSMESPNGPASSQNKSQDSIMLKIDPYVGDNQYRNLSVMDNLELYFREQVFPASRPCFPDLYLRDKAYSSLSTSTDGKSSLNSPKNTANSGKQKVQDYSLRFVSSFSPEERFITLFCEKVIDLKDGMNQSSIVTVDANDDDEAIPRRSSKASKNERGILGGSGRESITAPSAGVAGESSERMPREIDAVIILTDVGFYMIDYNEINPKTTFAESPLFTVLCALPLYKLSTCTIYFGFQRCALGFYDNPYQLLENYQKGLPVSTNISDMLAAYMIVTRDKSHTYPISTRIPQVANIQRNGMKPQPLNNVKIDNKDGQLLEQLMKVTGDPDVSYYQLLYQTWRKKPGVRLPRSIIVTKSTILLCAEDLCSIDVKLTILDQYSLKDILKIYHEDSNTLHIVIKFKRMNVLSVQKKWRLYTDSRNISTRIMEELKRSCEEVGNGDV